MKAKLTLEDGRTIDIELTPEQEKAIKVKKVWRWKPSKGEIYYTDDGSGVGNYKWDDDSVDEGCYETGELYQTEEQAQFARDRKVFITKVNDRIDELNDGWIPDWSNSKEWKYIIDSNPTLGINCASLVKSSNIFHYIKSNPIAEQIISEFKDDLMKYIFN